MTSSETFFGVLVLCGFAAFIGSLAWAQFQTSRKG